ncbi:MAG: hypothetical protein ABJL99_18045 [Aliishimia sp.]
MPRPNTQFELSVEDLELIETALMDSKASLADVKKPDTKVNETVRGIHDLLGRLHNQKEFYRPRQGVYVGG